MILNRDAKGNLLISRQPNFTGSVLWMYPKDPDSPDPASMGDQTKAFWHNPQGNVYGRWAPTPGKDLFVLSTMLIVMNGCDLESSMITFRGMKGEVQSFARVYSKLLHYLVHADRKIVFPDRTEYHWDYDEASAIVLKSSELAAIECLASAPFSGGDAYLRLKCLSLPAQA